MHNHISTTIDAI